jgi:hypothetical protein
VAHRREELRAADADRQYVADRLRDGLNEGRLDLGEYDDRLQQTYAARTYGDLDKVLADLPTVVPPDRAGVARSGWPPASQPGAPGVRPPVPPWLIAIWGTWLTTSVICFVIWALTGAHDYPWPIWVAGPWGALLLLRTLAALVSGDPASYAQSLQSRNRYRRRDRR